MIQPPKHYKWLQGRIRQNNAKGKGREKGKNKDKSKDKNKIVNLLDSWWWPGGNFSFGKDRREVKKKYGVKRKNLGCRRKKGKIRNKQSGGRATE